MGYVLKAVLSSAQHPEYGQITVPFPIPDEKYDRMIELLEPLEIGDALRQDCRVDELDSFYKGGNLLKQKVQFKQQILLAQPKGIQGLKRQKPIPCRPVLFHRKLKGRNQ